MSLFYVRALITLIAFCSWLFIGVQAAVAETIKSYYPDGKLLLEIATNDVGLPHGVTREFAPDGILRSEKRYEDGRSQGISKLFYPSGKIMTEWAYSDDKRNGLAIGYFENGKIKDKGYYKNDKLDGIVLKYRISGILKSEMQLSGDLPDGITKTYDSNGALEHEYTYSKGQLLLRKTFDRHGGLIRTQEYKPQMFSPY